MRKTGMRITLLNIEFFCLLFAQGVMAKNEKISKGVCEDGSDVTVLHEASKTKEEISLMLQEKCREKGETLNFMQLNSEDAL
jgi:hypothetical protein